ncbi:hypothetical protein HN011_007479 [Eciton burchellii]|nr:hypothetical protein HN011_007479 [Eciton burchellii]
MTYPGLVLLVGFGIGLATFLYHVFTENNRLEAQQYSADERSLNHTYDDWTERSHHSENAIVNKRARSNVSREDTNCSICQYSLNGSDVTQLYPCKHNFHKECIDTLKTHDPQALCPNCRRVIKHMISI